MKRLFTLTLTLCLLLTMVPMAHASETEATEAIVRQPGQCGEDLTWSYESGTLTISGSGSMDDYPDGDAPWLEHKDSIQKLVFTGGVTSVGEGAFTDYDELETVDFGSAMHTIGVKAFKSCDGLTSVILPASFRRFGKECFMGCKNLTEIYCLGGMPSFNGNCVWDVHATIYYPTNNAWPTEPVMQLISAFQNRIQFQAGNPDITPTATEAPQATQPPETTAPTQPVQTLPEETVAETRDVITVSMVEPQETTQATTEATKQTVPETTQSAAEETVPETQPPQRKHLGSMRGIVVCAVLFAGVISFLLIGALVFRRRRY